jgi:polygalacturonase
MKTMIKYKSIKIISILAALIFLGGTSPSFSQKDYFNRNNLSTTFTGDGVTDNTEAIQSALDSVSATGGGVIRFSNGKYLTGPLNIKSNDTLYIDSSAGIIGTTRMTAYYKPGADTTKPPGSLQPLLTADHADNIAIIGRGYIDGQGQEWWTAYNNGTISVRPRLFQPNYCNNLLLKNITLKNSPQFHFIPEWCNNVIVDSVTILAPSNSPNTDGIDPATCHNVHILNCYIDTGDDNVAVKSGYIDHSDPHAASTKIYVSHCTFLHGHGVSIGSETGGGVDSMYVDSCTFNGTTNGIRIKSYRGNGGNVRGVYYTNLTMTNVKYPIYFSEYYPNIPSQSDPAQPVTSSTPQYHDITVRNFTSTGSTYGGVIVGVPEMPLTNIHLENINISSTVGIQVRNATVDTNTANVKISRGLPFILEVNGYVNGPTSVIDNILPSKYSLSQNYPNPFNPSTKIKYTIPAAGTGYTHSMLTTLKVYDLLGNELAVLVNKEQLPESYEVEFNAAALSSGIYFYQLKSGNFISTKKMVLLK